MKIYYIFVPFLILIGCFYFIFQLVDIKEKRARILDYKDCNISTTKLPNFEGNDYTFINKDTVIYSSGNNILTMYNINSKTKETVKYKTVKNGFGFGFEYNRKKNCVYFLCKNNNEKSFIVFNINKKTFEEISELKYMSLGYFVVNINEGQYIHFNNGTNVISIFDLEERKIVDYPLPYKLSGSPLRAYNPEGKSVLFSSIDYSDGFSNAKICHYLLDMNSNKITDFQNYSMDGNKFNLHNYIYLDDYKFLCINTFKQYKNNILIIDMDKNIVIDVFSKEIQGEIDGLKKVNENKYGFLMRWGHKNTYLCVFSEPPQGASIN
jgi:hypothetical protein